MAGPGTSSVRSYNFFLDVTVANTAYEPASPNEFMSNMDPDMETGFLSHTIMFSNDGADDLLFSFNGEDDHGRIAAGESLQQDFRRVRRIWLRTAAAAIPTRFWAW